MTFTLLDEQGVELTEVTSHLGRSDSHMLFDGATRTDLLFHYYFDRGSRTVTAVIGAAKWSARLGTRWQMGARLWFLHEFLLIDASIEAAGQADSIPESLRRTEDTGRAGLGASAALDLPDPAPRGARRSVPA
ncbi:MAG: hypothetical protein M3P30_14190 [Chloroflexota bacterium]|nr:hypothetical protein [Chloroflexota bacterium]